MERDDQSGSPDDLETHPLNLAARRRPGDYWNEHILPVTDWEAPEHRVVLPSHLQQRLGPETPPVLRWDAEKVHIVQLKHVRDRHVLERLPHYLDGWRYVGHERGSSNVRILFQDENARWYSLTAGALQGSFNVVTVFGGSDRSFLDKRLRGMVDVVVRFE